MGRLSGRTVALPEMRQLDVLAALIEDEGGRTLRCPLVAIEDASDPGVVRTWIETAIQTPFDVIVFYTGEGVRRLAAAARECGQLDALVSAWKKSRKVTRGPKPVRALRELGLESDVIAEQPTTVGLIATLAREPLEGRTVGVQLFGEATNEPLMTFFNTAGARVISVAPYRYASAAEDQRVQHLIGQLAGGTVDAIAFTSSAQVDRLFAVAAGSGCAVELNAGLARTVVAAVGPVMADALRARAIRVDVIPERSFTMKPLVRAISEALSSK